MLARAELVDPAILLLDEATANLDLSTEARAQRDGAGGQRPHDPAHRPPPADPRSADRIFVVDDGRIVEQGSHDELLELAGAYADLSRALAVAAARWRSAQQATHGAGASVSEPGIPASSKTYSNRWRQASISAHAASRPS